MVTGYLRAALNALRQQFLRAAAKYAMVFRFFCCMLFGVSIFVCTKKACLQQGMGMGWSKMHCPSWKTNETSNWTGYRGRGTLPKAQTWCSIHWTEIQLLFLLIYLLTLRTYTYKTRLSLCRLLFKWKPLRATNSTSWDGWADGWMDGWCSSAGEEGVWVGRT